MLKNTKQKLNLDRPATYQIKVPGELDNMLSDWDVEMIVTIESDGNGFPISTLTSTVD